MKIGVDDFLADGGDLEDLRQRATSSIPLQSMQAPAEELTPAQQRFLRDEKTQRLLHGQCEADEDPRPNAVDFRFILRLCLRGCRDPVDLHALLRHRLVVSERVERSADDVYVRETVENALKSAEALVMDRVDVSLAIDEIVVLQPEDNRRESTYRVVGVHRWVVEVDQLTLLDARRMRAAVMAETARLPDVVKARDWDEHVTWALEKRSRVEIIPAELSEFGLIRATAMSWLLETLPWTASQTGLEGVEEVSVPFPHENADGEIVTTLAALMRGLRTELPNLNAAPTVVGQVLRGLGVRRTQRRLGGKRVKVWVALRASLPDTREDETLGDDAGSGGDGGDTADPEAGEGSEASPDAVP